ncbi:MAG: hypothetical protein AAGG75_19590 [Bacteroidota bacterium]
MNFTKININPFPAFYLLAVALVLTGFTGPDSDGDGDKITAYKQNKYRKDATRLALRLVSDNKDYQALNAEAPKDMVSSIYDALIAVHRSNHKMARLVTRTHKLHTFPIPSVDRFFVVYKREASWARPLRLGDTTTDSEEINKLLDQYGLIIDKHVDWDEEHNSFNVRAKESLNIAPIANAFSLIEEIVLVDLLMPNGDGNDIELKKIDGGWELNYVIKFDSCISGCKKRHIWTFEVRSGNQVSFIGESGDDLPDWMSE